jgi:hypothetical protein
MPKIPAPDVETLRSEALLAGALDPMNLRFNIVEYARSNGEVLSIPFGDLGFREAIEIAADLIEARCDSCFCLQPVGFVQ